MFPRISGPARQVLALADAAARSLNHEYIGTEHILLGLIQDDAGTVAGSLKALGVDSTQIRVKIEQLVQSGPQAVSQRKLPFTPRAKRAIECAEEEAWKLQQDRIGSEHLLLGLLCEQEGVGGQVLLSLGLRLDAVRERVLELRMSQLKFVERIVRPVRAGTARKRKLREELLAHLTAVYDEELARLHDPTAAMRAAVERFGEPAELTRELEAALPASARREYWFERRFGWRPPESAACWTRRLAMQLFAFMVIVCTLGMVAPVMIAPWQFWQWRDLRQLVAFVVLMPASAAMLGLTYFKLRDALFGVFGTRKSWFRVCQLELQIVLFVFALGVGYVAFSEWDLMRARDFLFPYGIAGFVSAIAALLVARRSGPTEIRDALWECLDIDGPEPFRCPPGEPAG